MRLLNDNGRFLRGIAVPPPTGEDDRIERLPSGHYRVSCERHGTFTVDVATHEEAHRAAHTFDAVQDALVDAMAWGSWPDIRRSRPRTAGERYFRDVSVEARRETRLLTPSMRAALEKDGVWSDDERGRSIRAETLEGREAYRVEVAEGSLVLTTHAASFDRAVAFVVLYAGLQTDLRRVLGWEPL